MVTRESRLAELIQAAHQHNWEQCYEAAFLLLYETPAELQIKWAGHFVSRYLPIYEKNWPEITWPRELVADIAGWVQKFGRHVPEGASSDEPAVASFEGCFDALVLAQTHRDKPFTLATACVCAVGSYVQARRANVWAADDPQAVRMWREGQYAPGRWVHQNVAATAVAVREWHDAAQWLKNAGITTYPEIANSQDADQLLAYWKAREMALLVPKDV